MCLFGKKKKKKPKPFKNTDFDKSKIDDKPKYELVKIYEKCIDEMTLQQAKRDQIITVFLAMFSFIVPFALSSQQFNLLEKGLIFLAITVIGYCFSLIIIRYRVYKEAYWICCQAITNLMSFKEGELDKRTIQAVYYKCLEKKADQYIITKKGKNRFLYLDFFKKNIFSVETIYSLVHSFIVSVLCALSVYLITSEKYDCCLCLSVLLGIVLFVVQVYLYFKNLTQIYSVLVDGTKDSFNKAFTKAWFLHLYIDKDEEEKKNSKKR